jgi:lipopolysaccharide transport system permease protein
VFSKLLTDTSEMVAEQVQFRELLLQMVRRDLLIRYKQSVMGFAWAIFMPLVNTILFSAVFMRVAPIEVGMPYPLFAFSGLLVWNLFSMALKFSTTSLTSNPNLVTKVYFPREIFPFSAVIVASVDSAVGAVVLAALMAYYGIVPTAAIAFLPVVILVHIAFTAGVALLLAMGNLFFRDVKYLSEVVITAWMFATTVLYPLSQVGGWAGALLRLNPMTPIVDAYRAVLLQGRLPDPQAFTITAIVSVIILFVGWLSFHRSEFQFAENI